jgi:hypothetical protein
LSSEVPRFFRRGGSASGTPVAARLDGADQIVRSATATNVFGIEVDNDITCTLPPIDKGAVVWVE